MCCSYYNEIPHQNEEASPKPSYASLSVKRPASDLSEEAEQEPKRRCKSATDKLTIVANRSPSPPPSNPVCHLFTDDAVISPESPDEVAFAPFHDISDLSLDPIEEGILEDLAIQFSPSAPNLYTPRPETTPASVRNSPEAVVTSCTVKMMVPENLTEFEQDGTDFWTDLEDLAMQLSPSTRALCTSRPMTPPNFAKLSPHAALMTPGPVKMMFTESREETVLDANAVEVLSILAEAQTVPKDACATHTVTVRDILESQCTDNDDTTRPPPRFSPSKEERIYIAEEDIVERDILCGRKERGTPHLGNIIYRCITQKYKETFQKLPSKPRQAKTKLTFSVLEEIKGRFVAQNKDKRYYLLTKGEVRNKIAQSLRER